MMIGIGTPRSQSRIPRPMGTLLSANIPRCTIADARILFPSGAADEPCAPKEGATNRSLRPATGISPSAGASPLLRDGPPLRSAHRCSSAAHEFRPQS
jgi:hypothetical protein